ncbi:MAG: hypothetical protein H7836_16170 [Magnetococcus sp. YQC-3]
MGRLPNLPSKSNKSHSFMITVNLSGPKITDTDDQGENFEYYAGNVGAMELILELVEKIKNHQHNVFCGIVGQFEIGDEEQRLHSHFIINCNRKITYSKCKSLLYKEILIQPHVESVKAYYDCKEYCTKKKGKVQEFAAGIIQKQGCRNDLTQLWKDIKTGRFTTLSELYGAYPQYVMQYGKRMLEEFCASLKPKTTAPEIIVVHGPPGNGKSLYIKQHFKDRHIHKAVYPKNSGKNIMYYKDKDMDVCHYEEWGRGRIPLGEMKEIVDITGVRPKVKWDFNQEIYYNYNTVIFSSVYPPEEWYPNVAPLEREQWQRRCKFFKRIEVKNVNNKILFKVTEPDEHREEPTFEQVTDFPDETPRFHYTAINNSQPIIVPEIQ